MATNPIAQHREKSNHSTNRSIPNEPIFSSNTPSKNILLLAPHDPIKDPRLDWMTTCAPEQITIVQVGTSSSNECIIKTAEKTLYLPQKKWKKGHFNQHFSQANLKNLAGSIGIQELLLLEYALGLSEHQFCELFKTAHYLPRNRIFRNYLQYLLQTTVVLFDQTYQLSGLHAVIATDLPTLPTALILKGLFDIPVFYDAHEYWPDADIASHDYEKQFWQQMENRLVSQVDYCQTVSSGLACLMSQQYKKPFAVVPNCVPLRTISPPILPQKTPSETQCRFIYQGIFAPERGLDLLINAWPAMNEKAILLLRGPDSSFKDFLILQAKKTGLFGQRIQFLPPVNEHELITALREGDVGIIPYTPFGQNYTHCCPNKLSQYMAAKLPILANETQFIKSILIQSDAGISVDFTNPKNLAEAVTVFIEESDKRIKMGEKGFQFVINSFNWETVSVTFYEQVIQLTTEKKPEKFAIFSTIDDSNDLNQFQMHQFITYGKLIVIRSNLFLWRTIIPKRIKKHLFPLVIYARNFLN